MSRREGTGVPASEQPAVVAGEPSAGWVARSVSAALTAILLAAAVTVTRLRAVPGLTDRDIPWAVVTALSLTAALGALHFVFVAVALRASAAAGFRLGEGALVQLAAATANRVTPAGLGGAGVNVRYLTRRGLSAEGALTAVSALAVAGALADLALMPVVLSFGGLGNLRSLLAQAPRAGIATGHLPWPVLVAAAGLAVVLVTRWLRRRPAGWRPLASVRARLREVRPRQARAAAARALRHAQDLVSQPRRLLVMLGASAATTLTLALAFVLTASALAGPHAPGPSTLLVGYLVAGFAAAAVPLPGAAGSAEATQAALLLATGVALDDAVRTVLVFRAVTFWAPAVAGLFAARWLGRRAAL